MEEIEIFKRVYDSDVDTQGNKKPNESLGKFLMTDEWIDEMNDYSFTTYGIKDGEIYQIIGEEVSGYYTSGQGGKKISVERLAENELVKIWEQYKK
jgi:hypothetical protein